MLAADRWYVRGVVLLLGSFVLLEIGLRVVLGLGSPPLMRADDRVGYVFQDNQTLTRFTNRVVINDYHQRSEPLRSAPDSSFTRILFLGDSVTWGGVLTDQSQTYPELIEPRLRRFCARPVEALNASAGSWGIPNLHAYAEKYGFFDSDAVVLQIGSHDLTQPKSTGEVVGTHPSYPDSNPSLATIELMDRYLIPRLDPYLPDLIDPPPETKPSPVPIHQVFRSNLDVFGRLVRSIHDRNIPVLVVHTPNRGEVAVPGGSASPNPYRQQFLQRADSLDVPVLNLATAWRDVSNVSSYYRDHVHLNENGNEALADTLSPLLHEHLPSHCERSLKSSRQQ